MTNSFIGLFDSGVGGLTVADAIRELLPHEPLFYFADNARAPYGPQPPEAVLAYSREITQLLIGRGAKLIVIACNTATSVAIDTLRREFPDTLFVGMEPAVKPAAKQTKNGKIGILATQLTLESERYHSLLDRFAQDAEVYSDPCIGLVPLIETGDLDNPALQTVLRSILSPMLAAGVDTVALGCTHYPLIEPLIAELCGPAVQVINPAPAAARRVAQLLSGHNLLATPRIYPPLHRFYTSGNAAGLTAILGKLAFGRRLIVNINPSTFSALAGHPPA